LAGPGLAVVAGVAVGTAVVEDLAAEAEAGAAEAASTAAVVENPAAAEPAEIGSYIKFCNALP
jgi:hypothetical protein